MNRNITKELLEATKPLIEGSEVPKHLNPYEIELAKEMLPDASDRFLKRIFDPNEAHKEFLIHVTVKIAKIVNSADIVRVLEFLGVIKEQSYNCYFCHGKDTVHWKKSIYYCHECSSQMNAVEFLMTKEKMGFEEAFRTVLEAILHDPNIS